MLGEMPERKRRHGDEPGVVAEVRHEHEQQHQDERVPNEVDPLDVERTDDALRIRAREVEHMDLDHLGDVLDEVQGLAHREESERREPGSGDEPVGECLQARRPQSATPANRLTSSM